MTVTSRMIVRLWAFRKDDDDVAGPQRRRNLVIANIMGTRGHMKVSTIAATVAALTATAAGVVTCKEASESPAAAPQGATASDAPKALSEARRLVLSGDAGPAPTYLNEPEAWVGDPQEPLQQFFHLSEGSEVFPYGALLAIDSGDGTLFFDTNNPTFGLLADPPDTTCDPNKQPWCNNHGVPVGMTVAKTRDSMLLDMEMFGLNCAACHVGELQAKGNTYRVLGGPNMFDAIGFVSGLKGAVGYTMADSDHVLSFLGRWAALGENPIGGTDPAFLALVQAAQAEVKTGSVLGQALAKALQAMLAEVSNETFLPRGPGLRLVPGSAPPPQQAPTLKPTQVRPGSRPDLPRGTTAFTLPPTRPTMTSVALLPKPEMAAFNLEFGAALIGLDHATQPLSPFEQSLEQITDLKARSLMLESFLVNYWEALQLLKERFSALSALGAGGKVGVESTPPGPGRVDAFMTARNILFPGSPAPATSPVDIPRIWRLHDIHRYHWDGDTNSLIERNVGQAVVIGAVIDPHNGQSTILIQYIQTLEDLAGKILPPPWPLGPIDVDAGPGAHGRDLFVANCLGCHGLGNDGGTSPYDVKTDVLRIHNFSLPMDGGGSFHAALKSELDLVMKQAYAYADAAADAQEDPSKTIINAPQQYANRSLDGVWATAPYLHNGSVASLADLLEPASARSSLVTVGGRVYDTDRVGYAPAPGAFSRDGGAKGDSMCDPDSGTTACGHPYGTELSADDKKALLEYLESL
jgi:hypothetical protein